MLCSGDSFLRLQLPVSDCLSTAGCDVEPYVVCVCMNTFQKGIWLSAVTLTPVGNVGRRFFFFVDGAFWNAGYSLRMVERITFCWQQEVKSNCSCGWQKLSQNADVHQYLAGSLPDILSDKTGRPSWIAEGFIWMQIMQKSPLGLI